MRYIVDIMPSVWYAGVAGTRMFVLVNMYCSFPCMLQCAWVSGFLLVLLLLVLLCN